MKIQSSYQSSGGKLYLVPTPIGNLDDMTYRAIKVLKEVDFILAEDTRHSIHLLNHFEIQTPMHSHHAHSHQSEIERWLEQLAQGRSIALISDAGMPLINDPGHELVQAAIDRDYAVIALPGATAALTALVASGMMHEHFTYYGFVPRKASEREILWQQIAQRQETALLYESPYRIKSVVRSIVQTLGDSVAIVIARELTKRYETYLRGAAGEILAYLEATPIKGEIVLLIDGSTAVQPTVDAMEELSLKDYVHHLMEEEGLTAKQSIKEVAKRRNIRKQEVYAAYHEIT